MTIEELRVEAEASATAVAEEAWYAIDPAWYEERAISLTHILHMRRCPNCQEQKGEADGGGRRKKGRKKEPWQEEMETIQECCSQREGYIASHMSIMEAAFRVLLKNGTRPLSTHEIYEGIVEGWAASHSPHEPSLPILQRLLAYQDTYGIRRQEEMQGDGA